jgi:hypothetical protein
MWVECAHIELEDVERDVSEPIDTSYAAPYKRFLNV